MGSSTYNTADLDQARTAIGGAAGKYGAVADAIPQSVDGGMFGTLGNSGTAAQAVSALCSQLRGEYTKAEQLVSAIERTLDQTTQNKGDTEQANQQRFRMA